MSLADYGILDVGQTEYHLVRPNNLLQQNVR